MITAMKDLKGPVVSYHIEIRMWMALRTLLVLMLKVQFMMIMLF